MLLALGKGGRTTLKVHKRDDEWMLKMKETFSLIYMVLFHSQRVFV